MNINAELLDLYVKKKLVNKRDAEGFLAAAEKENCDIREYLYKKELINEISELDVLSEYYHTPSIELDMLRVDRSVLSDISLDYLKKNKFLPIKKDENGVMIVAVANPLGVSAKSAVSAIYGCPVDYVLTTASQLERRINSIAAQDSMNTALDEIHNGDPKLAERINAGLGGENYSDETVDNPGVRLVDSIIKEAIPTRASDIHIEPFEKYVRVRYRIDGDLQERATFPITAYPAICARIKILSGINIAERRIPQDGRINVEIGGVEYDFRVSTLPSVHGEKFVIRILDKTSFKFTRSDLGFTESENAVIDKMLARPYGIILLTGPTGCGKSTTLYSFLKEINKSTVNIVTVEDPVEYSMPGVTQTQVNTKANMTFAAALRSILRQDPDVIMIGEIRDEETAEIAVRAAITGHLVFSTLHTNDAPGAVTRLEDMHIPDYLLSDSIVGVIAQRLVKRLCPACKKKAKTTEKEMQLLGLSEPAHIYHAQGCQYCNHTGYKGRVAVHEIMYVNKEMKEVISNTRNSDKLRAVAKENGLVTLWESCKNLVLNGETSIQELMTMNIE